MDKSCENALIIDDDNWNYRIISRYLNNYNIKTNYAEKALEGLANAVNNKPDLILLDLVLPELSGIYVLKTLKLIESTKDIPVLILSGNIDVDTIRLTKKYGAKDFISKPYKESTILEKLKVIFPHDRIFDLM